MIKIAVLFAVLACAYGNFYNTGSCPAGRAVGDKWNPASGCSECYCDLTGYGCSSCDTVTPVIGCYETVDTSLNYPECCPRLKCPSFNGLGQ